jgi:hypothetical protein
MDIREEIINLVARADRTVDCGMDEDLRHEDAADKILSLLTSPIQWEGCCGSCKLEWAQGKEFDNSGSCHDCNGTGTIKRPATIEEVVEVGKRLVYRATETSYSSIYTLELVDLLSINNGKLTVED